jgi:hypothetical protein
LRTFNARNLRHHPIPVLHSIFTLALVHEAVRMAHNVIRFAVRTQFEAEQIARRFAHNFLQRRDGLFDPVDRVLD